METQNDFMLLRQVVNDAVKQYTDLRKRIDWKDKGRSATIMRLAKPFQDGFFTIAVAGKMSSGKSTFINSLIGENLLPTGHFQTTSGITWIVSSDKRYMEVTYADGKKRTFTQNLAEELHKLVAVPEKFSSLPINHINILIKGGDDLKTILQKKAGIEEMTNTKGSAQESLWKEYINKTPKSSIAEKVVIYLQLPKEYEGWRIIDTPGVGAVGGIQDATKKLLTDKEGEDRSYAVDAVVLLHNSRENIEDESANTFAEDIRKSMGDLAKGRLFFVLTHASDQSFIQHKKTTLDKANSLFGSKLNIPQNRINYVDSLIHHFITAAKKSKKDFSDPKVLNQPLPGWSDKDWEIVKGVISPFYFQFMTSGKECTNNALFAELENVSRFDSLRSMLYEFFNDEKENAFSQLLDLIQFELNSYGISLSKDIESVSNGKAAIDKQIEDAKKEKRNLDIALGKVRDKVTPGIIDEKFSFIDVELGKLSQLETIGGVRTKFLQIIEKAISTEKTFFGSLISEFSTFIGNYRNTSSTFASIDFQQIERDAERAATSQVTDYNRPETESVCCGEDKRTYPHKKDKIDFEKKKREFTTDVIMKGRNQSRIFKEGLKRKTTEFLHIASNNINEKTYATVRRLENYKKAIANRDAIITELRGKLAAVEKSLSELKKYEYD